MISGEAQQTPSGGPRGPAHRAPGLGPWIAGAAADGLWLGEARLRLVPGPALSPAERDGMWALRASLMRFKPEHDLAAGRRAFDARLALGQQTVLLHDRAEAVVGMFSVHWAPADDGSALYIFPEYGFLHVDHRASPGLALGAGLALAQALRAAEGRPVWFGGIGYPRSFQSLGRGLRPLFCLADAGAPPAARAALAALHQRFAATTTDPVRHRVWLPTLPEPAKPGPKSAIWARYEAVNPDWAQGYGLGFVAPVGWATVGRVLGDVAARARVRRRRAEGGVGHAQGSSQPSEST